MSEYAGKNTVPEVWAVVAEHRGRKELQKIVPIRPPGGIRPKDPRQAEKFHQN